MRIPLTPHHLDLIGPIPRPNGGVAQHVWRLAMRMSGFGCRVLDLYPADMKYKLPGVTHQCSPRSWLLKPAWLYQKLRRAPTVVTHVHFSTTNALSLGCSWLPRRRPGQMYVLTLHHGQLFERHQQLNRLFRNVAAFSIRSFDRVIALSNRQHEFYADVIGVPADCLVRASSHISLPREAVIPPVSLLPAKNVERLSFVASGGIAPHYGHADAIKLISDLRSRFDVQLTLCLYGPRDDREYLDRLRSLAARTDGITFHFDLDLPDFLKILATADIYLRPSTVDSFGLAVADAMALGVPAVASDVCDRCHGTALFPAGDYEAFKTTVEEVVDDLPRRRAIIAQTPQTDSLPAYLRAYQLTKQADVAVVGRAA